MSAHVFGFYVFGAFSLTTVTTVRLNQFGAQSYSSEEESIASNRDCENGASREIYLSAALS